MPFQKFTQKGDKDDFDGIALRKNSFSFSVVNSKRFLGATRVLISYDVDKKVILLTPTSTESPSSYRISSFRKNSDEKAQFMVSCGLYKIMPSGRYLFQETTSEGHIFKLQ